MIRYTAPLLAFLAGACLYTQPAQAALKPGDAAPDFTAQAAVGGKVFAFSLKDALKHGPVVLYFFPKAFTGGCTVEAHDFAEAADSYKALGATLLGMSADPIATEQKFSSAECRNRFPVAADPDLKVIGAYDVVLTGMKMFGLSNRTSYVIAPDGHIYYAYTDLAPDQHVANTLAALKRLKAAS